MNKKNIIILLLSLTAKVHSQGLEPFIETQKRFPNIVLEINVKDENNKPIPEAFVSAHDNMLTKIVPGSRMESKTNNEGFCLLKFKALAGVVIYSAKEGDYYPTTGEGLSFDPFNFDPNMPEEQQQNPLPFKKEISLKKELTLRKIIKPIPLYAKRVRLQFPARNEWLGYDLEMGDWTPPHGKGKQSDLKFRSNPKPLEVNTSKLTDEGSIEIDFGLGGGVVKVTEKTGYMSASKLKMPHRALTEGYDKQVFTVQSKEPENLWWRDESKNEKGYFFRTRAETVGGSVVSANYGKIFQDSDSPPFKYYLEAKEPFKMVEGKQRKNHRIHGGIQFMYYFNPKPNDTNLEFDWKKNLFKINKIKGDGYSVMSP